MAGSSANTSLWQGADVYISRDAAVSAPTDLTTPWGSSWELVGLLDGEEGITQEREEETSEHYAWGGVLYRRTKSKHKRTFKFVALEDNDTVFDLVNPGSTRNSAGGVRTSVVKLPKSDMFSVGFELVDATRTKRRFARTAEVIEVGEVKESETDPTVYEITVLVFPESDGTLFTEIENDPNYVAP